MTGYTDSIVLQAADLIVAVRPVELSAEDALSVLSKASTIIETISGVIFDSEFRSMYLMKSDALWVHRATMFQAIWMLDQPDALSRLGASSVSQDGLSVSAPDELTFVLAPMAKRALQNCSWAKNSTLRVATDDAPKARNILISDEHPWTPMGSN